MRYAAGVLIYNIFVVLWGALVRATGSGAGCGSHWPLCNGEIIPRSPVAQTLIEFTHRVTSGVALASVLLLCIWAFRLFPGRHRVRRFAVLSLAFILIEALLGAGLVLLEYVAQNASIGRAFYLSAHLANTQVLLAMLALCAWFARPLADESNIARIVPRLAGALPVLMIVSISGAIAALGDTLFPATSLAEGISQEMSSTAHILLRLRLLHPALAVCGAVYVLTVAFRIIKAKASRHASLLAWTALGLVIAEMIAGVVNVLLLAPVSLQIVHLLLADMLWVTAVLLVVEGSDTRELKHL